MRRPYPSYRHSGVEWLGDVPEHWEVKRLERVASYRTSSVDKKTKDREQAVKLCNYTDVYYRDRIRASDADFMEATASPHEITRFGLSVGDVLITKDSEDWTDIAVPALVEESADDFVCGYHLGIIRPGALADATFIFRTMQSEAVNRQLQIAASGVTRYGLPSGAVSKVSISLPPLDEQRSIAAFLDHETAKIDSLITKKRLLLDRLAEYRTALITRTVTKGLPPEAAREAELNPNPPLKASEVEWIGDIPEHWLMTRLRFLAAISTGDSDTIDEVEDGQYPFFVRSDHVHAIDSYCYDGEAVLIAGDGNVEDTIHHYVGRYDCHQRVYQLNQLTDVDGRYLYHYLKVCFRSWITDGTAKSTVASLRMPMLQNFPVSLPPFHEQRVIAAFLDGAMERVGDLCSRVETAIERLQEYRTALITAAVTGKIDVRDDAQRAATVETVGSSR